MYLRIKLLIIVTLGFYKLFISQIFNCEVQVIAPTLQNNPANEEIFSSLKNAMIEYINFGYNWTNDKFEQHEQIDVSFSFIHYYTSVFSKSVHFSGILSMNFLLDESYLFK
tara:strand:- start:24 stop:356 length:333 start_codon:yes stop_codon:yes gene_type:complete